MRDVVEGAVQLGAVALEVVGGVGDEPAEASGSRVSRKLLEPRPAPRPVRRGRSCGRGRSGTRPRPPRRTGPRREELDVALADERLRHDRRFTPVGTGTSPSIFISTRIRSPRLDLGDLPAGRPSTFTCADSYSATARGNSAMSFSPSLPGRQRARRPGSRGRARRRRGRRDAYPSPRRRRCRVRRGRRTPRRDSRRWSE